MKHRILIPAVLLGLSCGLACRGGGPSAQASPSAGRPEASPSTAAGFQPPADGRLTSRQVEMYFAVQRKLAEGGGPATPAAGLPSVEDLARLATASRRAAEALGHDADEYAWVEQRVIEASPPPAEPAMAVLNDAIRGLPAELRDKASPAPTPPAAAREYNRDLIERHRSESPAR